MATIGTAKIARITWIDFFKGFGMILVVLGHSGMPHAIEWWIWSFHMPLFFFISGYLFNAAKVSSIGEFMSKRVRGLLLPYVVFSILNFLLFCLAARYTQSKLEVTSIHDWYQILAYGWKGLALWFIPVLFVTELIFYALRNAFVRYFSLLLIVLFSIVGYILSIRVIHFPYKLDAIPMALVFYALGNVSKTLISGFLNATKKEILALLGLGFLVLNIAFCFLNNARLDMAFNSMGNFFYTYISASAGILFAICFSNYFSATLNISNPVIKIFNYLGKHTLIVLSVHQMLKIIMNVIFQKLALHGAAITAMKQLLFWVLLAAIIFIVNKYFYLLLGRKKPI